MAKRGSIGIGLAAAAAVLGGCEAEPEAVRPGTQPLASLNTPEARQRIKASEAALPEAGSGQAQEVCEEILQLSSQGRLVLDRSDADRLVVNAELWGRVPDQAQRAIVDCVRAERPESTTGSLVVVESDPAMFEP